MIGISCKNGKVFSACDEDCIDAEWKLQEFYYKAQGCEIIKLDEVNFEECDCEHCKTLEHQFHKLIDEIIEENA